MRGLGRLTDIGIGLVHPSVTIQIFGSLSTYSNSLNQERLFDLHAWHCGVCGSGIGFNITGSTTVFVDNRPAHRLFDLQAVCTIEMLVTASHNIFNNRG